MSASSSSPHLRRSSWPTTPWACYELAAIHLGADEPALDEAKVAVDAFGALVDALGDRLGEDSTTLRDALAQIRLAYVQVKAALESEQPDTAAGGAATDDPSSTN